MIPSYYPPEKSLYASYMLERESSHTIECDSGFITYQFTNGDCYIKDLFVVPEYRKSHIATVMADQVAEIAKKEGCLRLIGSVVPSANNSTDSVKVLLAYGFKIDSSTNNFILFTKDLV